MGIKEILERFAQKQDSEEEERDFEKHDTKDKFLISLRKQRQRQLEQEEKEELKKNINEFYKEEVVKKLKNVKQTSISRSSMMDDPNMLNFGTKQEKRKPMKNRSFIGKSML